DVQHRGEDQPLLELEGEVAGDAAGRIVGRIVGKDADRGGGGARAERQRAKRQAGAERDSQHKGRARRQAEAEHAAFYPRRRNCLMSPSKLTSFQVPPSLAKVIRHGPSWLFAAQTRPSGSARSAPAISSWFGIGLPGL